MMQQQLHQTTGELQQAKQETEAKMQEPQAATGDGVIKRIEVELNILIQRERDLQTALQIQLAGPQVRPLLLLENNNNVVAGCKVCFQVLPSFLKHTSS